MKKPLNSVLVISELPLTLGSETKDHVEGLFDELDYLVKEFGIKAFHLAYGSHTYSPTPIEDALYLGLQPKGLSEFPAWFVAWALSAGLDVYEHKLSDVTQLLTETSAVFFIGHKESDIRYKRFRAMAELARRVKIPVFMTYLDPAYNGFRPLEEYTE